MAQITLGSKTTLNLSTDLDPMFTDLYGYAKNLVSDANGNVGLGVTPSYGSARYAFQLGPYGSIDGNGGSGVEVMSNAQYSAGWKYIATAPATQYYQTAGTHVWLNAASGTAGSAITWVQSKSIDANGNLLINRTTQVSGGKVEISGNLVLQPSASAPTLGANGDLSFQLVSNTSLKILVRGSDGVTRSTTLTLA
jgi:hypothetical protein